MKTDKFTLFVYCNFHVLLSKTVCSKNINKHNVNIADETLTDYSFLSGYHYTKSKNSLKRRFRIRHWIPMFIGTTCTFKGWDCKNDPKPQICDRWFEAWFFTSAFKWVFWWFTKRLSTEISQFWELWPARNFEFKKMD